MRAVLLVCVPWFLVALPPAMARVERADKGTLDWIVILWPLGAVAVMLGAAFVFGIRAHLRAFARDRAFLQKAKGSE